MGKINVYQNVSIDVFGVGLFRVGDSKDVHGENYVVQNITADINRDDETLGYEVYVKSTDGRPGYLYFPIGKIVSVFRKMVEVEEDEYYG